MKFYKILFSISMILGTLIAISSYSWLSMWMGLEINLLSIIPLLKDEKNLYPTESAIKYFITQALASSILLLSVILSLNLIDFYSISPYITSLIMNSAILTKMGAAPFHSWFPEVMEGLNWLNSLIMLTWQKIAPMILITYNCGMTYFLLIIIVFSTVISGILGLNQISMRKILAYSSINHISWMLASMLHSQTVWVIYFLVYSVISLNLILMFNYFKIFYLNQFFLTLMFNKSLKFFFILNFLSLGGLPPFLGFFPKWLVINNLILNEFYMLSTMLIIFTLITLYFYLRISFTVILINSTEIFNFHDKTNNFFIYSFNFIVLLGLLICTLIFNNF